MSESLPRPEVEDAKPAIRRTPLTPSMANDEKVGDLAINFRNGIVKQHPGDHPSGGNTEMVFASESRASDSGSAGCHRPDRDHGRATPMVRGLRTL